MPAGFWASADGPAADATSHDKSDIQGQRSHWGPQFCEEESGGRLRDLLPIPLGAGLAAALRGTSSCPLSQSQIRRARRQRSQEKWLVEAIRALNEMGGQGVEVPLDTPLTIAQFEAVRRMAAVFGRLRKPPPELDPLGAWKALQGNRSGYSDDSGAGVALATYQRGAVSLPVSLAGLVDIEGFLPPPLQELLFGATGLFRSEGPLWIAFIRSVPRGRWTTFLSLIPI